MEFVLYGGTAIALQLGHRQSVDFDFFSNRPLDPTKLVPAIPFLAAATVTQREPNTFSCLVDRGGPVKLSFFGLPRMPRLLPPLIAPDNGLQVASLLDLAGMKASVVQMRAEAKDYLDIDAILTDGRIDLPAALASARVIYGRVVQSARHPESPRLFDDGNVRRLPQAVKDRLVQQPALLISTACRSSPRRGGHQTTMGRMEMKPIPLTPETEALARRLVWFEEPVEALAEPARFIAYALESATHEDMKVLLQYVTEDDIRETLGSPSTRHYQAALLGLLACPDGALSGAAFADAEFWVIGGLMALQESRRTGGVLTLGCGNLPRRDASRCSARWRAEPGATAPSFATRSTSSTPARCSW